MFTALTVVSLLLTSMLIYAAVRKLSHRPEVVATYVRVGVPEKRLNLLALLLLLGAAGLLAGVIVAPIGIVTATCLVVYFLVAVGAHVRHRDTGNAVVPVVMLLMSMATLALRVMTSG